MKTISLTQGKIALVDDSDYADVAEHKWCFRKGRHEGATGYATGVAGRGRKNPVLMHHFILGHNQRVDHKDGNGLNNQRDNLRLATNAQNVANARKSRRNTSGFKGVTENRGKWVAGIRVNGRRAHLGRFSTAEEAARAYDKAAVAHFGEFAKLNFEADHGQV